MAINIKVQRYYQRMQKPNNKKLNLFMDIYQIIDKQNFHRWEICVFKKSWKKCMKMRGKYLLFIS